MKVIGIETSEAENSEEVLEKLDEFKEEHDVFIQVFDAGKVIGDEHLLWAYQKAEESFESGTNRANSLEIETLLWASAEWQIKDALEKMGLKDDAEKGVVLIEHEELIRDLLDFMDWSRDDDAFEPDREKLREFGVKETEMRSVEEPIELVFEKMATSVL